MKLKISLFVVVLFFAGCSDVVQIAGEIDEKPSIFPDYTDVTIPENIAPLHFRLENSEREATSLLLTYGDESWVIRGEKGAFQIPSSRWKKMLQKAKGQSIQVTVCVKRDGQWLRFQSFRWNVAPEPIDPYIAYRLIAPGYALWNVMGIYQRNIENNKQSAVIENKMTGENCMNCHSFCSQDPDKMLFHMRKTNPGTYLLTNGTVEKLNTKTDRTISAFVYPSWHPSGNYVAFSVNDTKQAFHTNDPNRIEVFDLASDVVVYDVKKHEVITVPALFSPGCYETFPTFSPDGRTLYFCTADEQLVPDEFKQVKYSLCAIAFDPEARTFGESVDTLYNAKENDRSVAFPRVSPDGKSLLYTLSAYGNFFIWHQDADLYLLNLETQTHTPLTEANSDASESYHSWSSNSRWIVFGSRRMDGLYTRPYFAYIDENGVARKAFVLPQKDSDFYRRFMQSYNIPEFIKGKITTPSHRITTAAKYDKGIDIRFSEAQKFPVIKPAESIAH